LVDSISNINNFRVQYNSLNSEAMFLNKKGQSNIDNKELRYKAEKMENKIVSANENLSVKDFEIELNNLLKDENLTLEFKKDDDTQKMIMKLIDNETEEVIKQYPPEVSLQIAKMVSTILEKNGITNVKV
jgi:flagellar protein FlaG